MRCVERVIGEICDAVQSTRPPAAPTSSTSGGAAGASNVTPSTSTAPAVSIAIRDPSCAASAAAGQATIARPRLTQLR